MKEHTPSHLFLRVCWDSSVYSLCLREREMIWEFGYRRRDDYAHVHRAGAAENDRPADDAHQRLI